MIAGRFKWRERAAVIPRKVGLAAFDVPLGTVLLTEAATQKRASLHVVRGEAALGSFNPGGLEVTTSGAAAFAAALQKESHTLKRALTDPHLFSGIGNAYSDEILHRARLSPFKLTRQLTSAEIAVLHDATVATLSEWTARLQEEAAEAFSRESHCVPRRDGCARPLRATLSALRYARSAHRPRRARSQLLSRVSDGGPAPGRPRALKAAEERLAEDTRRARTAKAFLKICIEDWQIDKVLQSSPWQHSANPPICQSSNTYCRFRARSAPPNATPVKSRKAAASTATRAGSPMPIVAYRNTSTCHVIGLAQDNCRSGVGSGSTG